MTAETQAISIPFDSLDVFDRNPNPKYFLEYAKQKAEKGNPESVLNAVDDFCINYARNSMNIGRGKGAIVEEMIKECNPSVAIELGGFMGYSAVMFARWLKPGAMFYSIEIGPEYAKLVTETVELAGLSDKVKVIVGSSESVIPCLRKKYGIDSVDFVFIDHWKTLYKPDLIRLVECGLLKKGSVIAADNVIFPGAPDYLEYVRNSPLFESTFFESHLEYKKEVRDGVEKSVFIG